MLLRLLPAPTAAQPAPPTILFTLPLPVSPYTGKSLPLPPQLQHHRSVCAQEGLECPNVLLGEKSSWISGIVEEVTFCVSSGRITVNLIDGTTRALPITSGCMNTLVGVIQQVQLSFSVQATQTAATPVAAPSTPRTPRTPTHKRSPSTLLYSLLSPLVATPVQDRTVAKPAQNLSRLHRRQARSLLVDAFRRHVLTVLRDTLPSSYLLWITQSELTCHQADWDKLKSEVDTLLGNAGVPAGRPNGRANALASRLARAMPNLSVASSSSGCSSDSSDDESAGPSTAATSTFSQCSDSTINPITQLSALPVASSIPVSYRQQYTQLVSELSSIASRMMSLRKRRSAMEREEGRRTWLESMEASRMQERAQRRAWSNKGELFSGDRFINVSRPMKASRLWMVESAEVEEVESALHPAMIEDMDMSISDSDEEDLFSANIMVRPISSDEFDIPARPRLVSSSSIDSTSSDESSDELIEDMDVPMVTVTSPKSPRMWTRELMDGDEEMVDANPEQAFSKAQLWGMQTRREVMVVGRQ